MSPLFGFAHVVLQAVKKSNWCNSGDAASFVRKPSLSMGRILRQIACAAGVMALVPTSRQLQTPSARGPRRSTLQMASQLETLEPQLKRVVITGMGIAQCMNQSSRRVRRC